MLKMHFPFVVPEKGERKEDSDELTVSEKFAIKQTSNAIGKIAGDAITAVGVRNLLNPQAQVTTVINARYVPQATLTVNEMRLSEQRRKLDLSAAKERQVKLTVKGSPGKGKIYRSRTSYVRADRTARGKIKVTPKGRDFLHSIETQPQRDKRLARTRNKARATIIGGRTLRYGVPALMVGWTVYDLVKSDEPVGTPEENLEYGLGGWAYQDATILGTIAKSGKTTMFLTAGNFDWSDLF